MSNIPLPFRSVQIVESGSNENGSYVKYSDGNMICRGSIIIEANTFYKTLNYPCEFINGEISIFFTNVYSYSKAILYNIATSTKSKIDVYPHDSSTNAVPVVSVSARWVAIGNWK